MVNKTAYDRVKAARRPDKIGTSELIHGLTTDFFELHGDRLEADDQAIIGGVGLLKGKPITVFGIQRVKIQTKTLPATLAVQRQRGIVKRFA